MTVRLLDADGNPVKDASGADITATTDANGNYTFTRLPMGSYKVEVVAGEAKVDGADVNLADYKQTYGYGSSTQAQRGRQGHARDADPDRPDERRAQRHEGRLRVREARLGG